MLLTELSAVKTILGEETSRTKEDTLLNALIALVSEEAEHYTAMEFETGTYTEELHVEQSQEVFLLKASVSSITSVKNSSTWDWSNVSDISSTFRRAKGRTLFVTTDLITGPLALQVVYVGGIAANAAALKTVYPSLYWAIAEQVAFMHRRIPQLETTSKGHEGATTSYSSVTWVKNVKRVLDRLKNAT